MKNEGFFMHMRRQMWGIIFIHWKYSKAYITNHRSFFISWIRTTWQFNCDFEENLFKHFSHIYGFSPVWHRRCALRYLLQENVFGHISHKNGFSLVWERECTCKLSLRENCLEHTSQVKGFDSMWMRRCSFRCPLCWKVLKQISHINDFSPVCQWRCALRLPIVENTFGHILQKSSFRFVEWMR